MLNLMYFQSQKRSVHNYDHAFFCYVHYDDCGDLKMAEEGNIDLVDCHSMEAVEDMDSQVDMKDKKVEEAGTDSTDRGKVGNPHHLSDCL